jgi:hypothetical protein
MKFAAFLIPFGLLVPVGGYALLKENTPSFSEAMAACMNEEKSSLPAHRTATCLCVVDEVRTIGWVSYKIVASHANLAAAERSLTNTCRANAYSSFLIRSTP